MKLLFQTLFTLLAIQGFGQNFTSFFTGNPTDVITKPQGGICMMGGATENPEAMKWFLQRCNKGDVLVLRASGSNGYNDFLYSKLGIPVNSVESIVFNNATAANEAYIQQKIQQAEGIWFAGGDQGKYVNYWRNTAIDSLINVAITQRHVVIGGTSAGMAILGSFYYAAHNSSATSDEALANPYHVNVGIDSAAFLHNHYLEGVITDTHYGKRNRQGRHVTFLARILQDWGIAAKGIACDEYTAVCVDPTTGLASVYANHPGSDTFAYFIQPNCKFPTKLPQLCTQNQPLTWNHREATLSVYQVQGTPTGANTFDLSTWKTGTGGTWKYWFVEKGVLKISNGKQPKCK